jgi:hypothetical protein
VGRGDHRGCDYVTHFLGSRICLHLHFLRNKVGFPRFLGTLWLSLTIAPEHLWVHPLGSRRCRRLLMGPSSLLVACAIPWGRASRPACLAPEALEECVYSLKVFFTALSSCEAFVSTGLGDVSAGLGGAMRMCLTFVCVQCISRRCSLALSPRAWARSRRSGQALRLICTPFRRPSVRRGVRCLQLPSSGS